MATDNAEGLLKCLSESAAGRNVQTIQLYKPDGHSLGFSVVGMKNELTDELGIYIQDIHSNGIAARFVNIICDFFSNKYTVYLRKENIS